MDETAAELADLQRCLDDSLSGSNSHLRGIITPGERALSAAQLVRELSGMKVLTVATVTARGEPRISAVDGHFLHGRWVFTTSGSASKARALRARPGVSAAYVDGERVAVFCHGQAEFLTPADADFAGVEDHLVKHYGQSPREWGQDIVYLRVVPAWMVAYSMHAADFPT